MMKITKFTGDLENINDVLNEDIQHILRLINVVQLKSKSASEIIEEGHFNISSDLFGEFLNERNSVLKHIESIKKTILYLKEKARLEAILIEEENKYILMLNELLSNFDILE